MIKEVPKNEEDAVDMDAESKSAEVLEDSEIEEESDKEPDSEIIDDEEVNS